MFKFVLLALGVLVIGNLIGKFMAHMAQPVAKYFTALAFSIISFALLEIVGGAAGMISGAVLGGMMSLTNPTFFRELLEAFAIMGALNGVHAGAALGIVPAMLIFRRKLKGQPLAPRPLLLKTALFAGIIAALLICAQAPQAIASLASMVAIVILSAALSQAIDRRGGPRQVRHDWLRMERWDWLSLALALVLMPGMFASIDGRSPLGGQGEERRPAHNAPPGRSRTANASESVESAPPARVKTPSSETTPVTYVVTTRGNASVHVRACASTSCAVLGRLLPNDVIQALESLPGEWVAGENIWVRFQHGDKLGYVHSGLLRPRG